MFTPLSSSWTPTLRSVLRFVVGLLFVVHGTQKLFGIPVPSPGGPVDLESLMGIAGVIEVVGGTLLFVGLFTRPMAFLLSGEMAVAYFMQHAPRGFWPLVNGGELAVLYCFIFLFFAAAGAGPISLDAWIGARRSHIEHAPLHRPHPASRHI